MKFAQSSVVYINYSINYAIRELHNLGYQGIEIWGGRPHMYRNDLDGEMKNIINLLKKLNMTVCNFIPAQFHYPSILCSNNEVVRQDSVEYIKTAMEIALKIGSPSISLCPGIGLFDEDLSQAWKQLLKSFKEIEEYNQDKKLLLLIEPAHRFESNLILTVEDCLRMINELSSDKFGILLDLGHCYINKEDLKKAIFKCKNYPLHIHIDDNNGIIDEHLIPGEGKINFNIVNETLRKINYNGFISAELNSTIYSLDPTIACKKTLNTLKNIFK